jgi:hypothetical protein
VVEILQDLESRGAAGLDIARLERLPADLEGDLLAWLREPEIQGPPNVYVREPFPTLKYLEFLFQTGRLTATARVPGEPHATHWNISSTPYLRQASFAWYQFFLLGGRSRLVVQLGGQG